MYQNECFFHQTSKLSMKVFQLCFKKGDVIAVTQKDEGWWEGTLNGKTGWFPSNYVEECKGIRNDVIQYVYLVSDVVMWF